MAYRMLKLNRFMFVGFHVKKSSGRGATQRGDFFEVSPREFFKVGWSYLTFSSSA